MPEFRIRYCQIPSTQHTPRIAFVEAATDEDARAVLREHAERKLGAMVTIWDSAPAVPPPPGRVLTDGPA